VPDETAFIFKPFEVSTLRSEEMSDRQVRVLVTDMGGVLFGPAPETYLDNLSKKYPQHATQIKGLHKAQYNSAYPKQWNDFKTNPYYSEEKYFEMLFAPVKGVVTESHAEHQAGLRASFLIYHDVLRLMEKAKAGGVEIAILSNNAASWVLWLSERYLQQFKPELIMESQTMGLSKPDPAIFTAAHKQLESVLGPIPMGEVAFIDDKSENTKAAAAQGWIPVQYDHDAAPASDLGLQLAKLSPNMARIFGADASSSWAVTSQDFSLNLSTVFD